VGIRAIVATGEHGESGAALRHVRRHFITVDNLRAAVTKLVNATFAARDTAWWDDPILFMPHSPRPRAATPVAGAVLGHEVAGPGAELLRVRGARRAS
jgi:hypothetical protein